MLRRISHPGSILIMLWLICSGASFVNAQNTPPAKSDPQARLNELAKKYAETPTANIGIVEPVPPVHPVVAHDTPLGSVDTAVKVVEEDEESITSSGFPDEPIVPFREQRDRLPDPIEHTPLGGMENKDIAALASQADHWRDSGMNVGLSTLSALGVVIVLILLVRWVWMKLSGRGLTGRSSVVEVLVRTSIAPRNHILLLRIGSRIIVASDSAQGMRTLAQITEPEEVAQVMATVSAGSPGSMSRNFSQLISGFSGEYDSRKLQDEGADESEHAFDSARNSISSLLSRVRTIAGQGGTS